MVTISDSRLIALQQWLNDHLPQCNFRLSPLAADASFRRYFRVHLPEKTLVVMDAPPDKENPHPFVGISRFFQTHGLKVPEIITADLVRGFLVISDFGDDLYFRILNQNNVTQLYENAIRELLIIQRCPQDQDWHFEPFKERMIEELARFREWYLLKHLNLNLSNKEETLLATTFETLIQSAVNQPQVCVHRDYHSRNLMMLANNEVGILDFQDAVWGPVTYDLVSLLRDCYIAWPTADVKKWAQHYFQQALSAGILPKNTSAAVFMQWFDWMGMQRHLKAIYIFARKFRRDGNPNYLTEIPRTLNYILEVSSDYPEFKQLKEFLQARVLPHESDDSSSGTRPTYATVDRYHT